MKPENFKHHYKGTIELYFETGMEGWASILCDHRGVTKGPSFSNETKQYDGPEQTFKTLEWAHFFGKKPCYAKVYDGEKTVYDGPLTLDRKAIAKHKYRFHFLPQEIEHQMWIDWCRKEVEAEIWVNEPVLAEEPQYLEEKKKIEQRKKDTASS